MAKSNNIFQKDSDVNLCAKWFDFCTKWCSIIVLFSIYSILYCRVLLYMDVHTCGGFEVCPELCRSEMVTLYVLSKVSHRGSYDRAQNKETKGLYAC